MTYQSPNKEGVRGSDPRWKTRTVEGIVLTKLRDTGEDGWLCDIEGEAWRFVQHGDRKWQGFTVDHITGTVRSYSLKRTVRWVIDHAEEWQAKVAVRRAKGTRLVDPA